MNKNILGTYIHGIFENDNFVDCLISGLIKKTGKKIGLNDNITHFERYKDSQYELLANLVEESLDIEKIMNILNIEK